MAAKTIADKLLDAFGKDGERWTKWLTVNHQGIHNPARNLTLAGALRYVFISQMYSHTGYVPPVFWKAQELIRLAICEDLGYEESIPFFNDHVAEDFSDIVRLLDRVRDIETKLRRRAA